jgi:hypothetical protein
MNKCYIHIIKNIHIFIYGECTIFFAGISSGTDRVGQNHIYMVCVKCFWQEFHHTHSRIRRIIYVLANPTHMMCLISEEGTHNHA